MTERVNDVKKLVAVTMAMLILLFSSAGVFAENNYPEPTKEFFANDFSNVLNQDRGFDKYCR
jgi:hypothetical protein